MNDCSYLISPMILCWVSQKPTIYMYFSSGFLGVWISLRFSTLSPKISHTVWLLVQTSCNWLFKIQPSNTLSWVRPPQQAAHWSTFVIWPLITNPACSLSPGVQQGYSGGCTQRQQSPAPQIVRRRLRKLCLFKIKQSPAWQIDRRRLRKLCHL